MLPVGDLVEASSYPESTSIIDPVRTSWRTQTMRVKHHLLLQLAVCVLPLWGCGATHSTPPPPVPTPLSITQQPQNASTPLGQTAIFTVAAVGTGTLSYQWSENGAAIQGATISSYTTPTVAAADTGEAFSVVVRDSDASATSSTATLTVGPRSPATGDLRFQQVDAASMSNGIFGPGSAYHAGMEYPWGYFYLDTVGSPLRIGGGICATAEQACAWFYTTLPIPAGLLLSVSYMPDVLENLDADLSSDSTSNTVVTSLDIESANDVFAMSYLQGPSSGFDYKRETVSLGGLAALVAQDATQSRVVTAITFDDSTGLVNFLSYGWASDKTTLYETGVTTGVTYDNIGPAAISLANDGYIITAFGGNPADRYVLVGTRVKGDSMPRPILVFPPAPSGTSVAGYAMVG